MRVFIAFVLSFGFVAAALTNQQRIVGGLPTGARNYPEIAALLLKSGATSFRLACGGTIINNRAIVTAAQCTSNTILSQWQLRLGSGYTSAGGSLLSAGHIINHPGYNWRTIENDIAIIHTSTAITYNLNIRPATVAGYFYEINDNDMIHAVGWGALVFGGPPSTQLQYINVRAVNQAICRSRYAELNFVVNDNMFCSGLLDVGGQDQCTGDAGGPVFHSFSVFAGITSFGEQCGHPRYPRVNTRVSSYRLWIEANS